ncbi:MAG: mechanosensitive ion channel domain-containing protein [Planctomycetota bacterium]
MQARLKQIDENPAIDEATKAKLRELYQQAIRDLESAKNWAAKAAQFAQMVAAAPGELQQVRADLAQLPAQADVTIPPAVELAEIEQTAAMCEAELQKLRADLAELDAEPKRRAARKVEIAKQTATIQGKLGEVVAEAAANDKDPLFAARQTSSLCRRRALEQELECCQRELAAYEASSKLLPLKRDLAARRADLAEQQCRAWRQIVNQRRQHEAERQVQQAAIEADQAHPAVRQLAEYNAALAERRKKLAADISATTALLEQTNQKLASLREEFLRAREKVDAVGLTNAVGLLLRKQRESLPDVSLCRRNLYTRQSLMGEGQLALLELGDRRAELANLEGMLAALLQSQEAERGSYDRAVLEGQMRDALETQKNYLDSLLSDYNAYFDKLVDLDSAERQLIDETDKCARYVDERVLWIASNSAIHQMELDHAAACGRWLLGPDGWAELAHNLLDDARRNPGIPAAALLALVPLVYAQRRLSKAAAQAGQLAAKATCYRFLPTLQSLADAVLSAAIWPALIAFVGWRLSAAVDASELGKAVGVGLVTTARVFFVLELVRQVSQKNGLAEAHFEWSESSVRLLRSHIVWLSLLVLPAALVCTTLRTHGNERWEASLGRIAFLVAMAALSVFIQRVMRPERGVFHQWLAEHRGHWLERLRFVWYPLAVIMPAALAGLAAAGYFYTAQQLAVRLTLSFDLFLGFVLVRALLLRWVLVNRRKLAIEQARQRRAAQADAPGDDAASAVALAEQPRDLATINLQTRRLVEYSVTMAAVVSLWLVWVDVAPALNILHDVELWQTSYSVAEPATDADGTATVRTVERLGAITLANLVAAGLVLAMMWIAAKNMPGLLEMLVLQHLPVDGGVRYAVVAVSRYVITIAGLMLACGALGVGWSKVQWLVAAVSVGLGFGLQEIFANFVSGLIILFERPVRVGDVITVGDVTGMVSRIRMRATTITDWDRKELVVPNKEFITARLLNWTLSDQTNRVVINVGLAYGSDTRLATELLLGVAREHPLVLDDPQPLVTFEAFGASSLDFVVRCYLPSLEHRLQVIHELHVAIDETLRAAGLEIAFPQQDIHLRSIDVKPEMLQAMLRPREERPPRASAA